MLRLLLLLGVGSALRVITRNMIRTPDDRGLPLEYHPVPLRIKEASPADIEREQKADEVEKGELEQKMSARAFELHQDVEGSNMTDQPEGVLTGADWVVSPTEVPQEQVEQMIEEQVDTKVEAPRRTTKLYPVSSLWTDPEDRQMMEPDLWGILRTAYYCLFAGLDCFSSRVFPLVQSFMGFQPHYPFPRSRQILQDEDRGAVMPKLMKELLLGLLLVNLPWLGGLGLASGKALLTSVLGFSPTQPYYM